VKLDGKGSLFFRLPRSARILMDSWAEATIVMTEEQACELRDELIRHLGDA